MVNELAPWRLLDGKQHLLGCELQQRADECGSDVYSHYLLLDRILADEGMTKHSLLHHPGSVSRKEVLERLIGQPEILMCK